MRYLKMLSCAIFATAAMIALLGMGTAQATVLCQTNTTPCMATYDVGQEVHMHLVAGTEMTFHDGFVEVKCKESTMGGTIENAGSSTASVTVPLGALTFGTCTGRWNVKRPGLLRLRYHELMNASLSSLGMEFEEEQAGVICNYGTPTETTLGPLTGGSPAIAAVSTELTKLSGGFLCASPAHWEAQYEMVSPNPVYVAES